MERLLYIIPECYVDTNLISTLVNAAVKKYGLSSDLNQLKKLTKKVTSNTDSTFTRVFKDLGTSSDFSVLTTALNYLIDNKFKSNEDELKKIFKG